MQHEYKVIPAPKKGIKAPGVKGVEARFSHAIQQVMNDHAAEGWEFLRSETLPSEERQGLTSSHTVFRSVLVFRRPRAGDVSDFSPEVLEDHSDMGEMADPAEFDGQNDTDWTDPEEVAAEPDETETPRA
ncbi:DUF4177 domain-containing protein [Lutimaribacter sp. EGI FJ00015]|uniref:DUF4177 domain-containing protein n=1 Tax=Lutimaribacter degradans TaxID=2945989 RepID=A0ACC5ZRD3_9RHOB|nr:DUF4177 domain-containing protein [Lutimaribacter sp. EGI FJ00013]MCM2560725.1 DUF4177 domain-containing protein [Lutimaribacter sp. EGI FJ00013]MCO0612330.1 DUF4177 domain-containing protein [Lutimaribacter sp. EGI FJ00015]MCO0634550.1 DUF4177 domain-containing protein [Lutimaribacter sp. EGI FJ00014]